MVQSLARQSVSVLDFAEDDVVFCTGNMAVASYSIMQGGFSVELRDLGWELKNILVDHGIFSFF